MTHPPGLSPSDELRRVASSLLDDGSLEELLEAMGSERASEMTTLALSEVLSEPWSYEFSRMFLRIRSAEQFLALCQLHGFSPIEPLLRDTWEISAVRQVYEPSLARVVRLLLKASAHPDGGPVATLRPLMCAALAGWVQVATMLLEAKALVQLRDSGGASALHYATVHQQMHLAALLLQWRADAREEDAFGRSPSAVAHLHGLRLEAGDEAEPSKRARVFQSRVMALDIIEVPNDRFCADFVAVKRPVLLRQAMLGSSRHPWSDSLLSRAAATACSVGTIPYGSDFGARGDEKVLSIRSFLEAKEPTCESEIPYYFFVSVDAQQHSELATLLQEVLGIPKSLPHPFEDFVATGVQFALGHSGSGSPMHFHHDAFNILLAGKKRWWLRPPSSAIMSRSPEMYSTFLISGAMPC